MKKHFFIFLFTLAFFSVNFAHEPLYGLGPETLPKNLNAIELGYRYKFGEVEYGFEVRKIDGGTATKLFYSLLHQ